MAQISSTDTAGKSLASMTNNLEKMIRLSRNAGAKVLLAGIKLPASYGKTCGSHFNKDVEKALPWSFSSRLAVQPIYILLSSLKVTLRG
ncbi:SGNH/GDSL hydrolase family protein [Thiolapillus brandeum]|uniref:hypothetical protein n=1 Tax=Thiolapillus brandeum TaxID=1076588 RepID=UPI0026CB8A1B|nr:hypothetical protein [Thiolapillus brandeum]